MNGSEFKDIRENILRMSITDMARKIGVTRHTIYNIEAKKSVPFVYAAAIEKIVNEEK